MNTPMEKIRTIASAKSIVMTKWERFIPILIIMILIVVSLILLIGG